MIFTSISSNKTTVYKYEALYSTDSSVSFTNYEYDCVLSLFGEIICELGDDNDKEYILE